MLVLKFGGASLADTANVANACDYVARCKQARPVVVVSACRGVTDRLLQTQSQAVAQVPGVIEASRSALAEHHHGIARDLIPEGPARAALHDFIEARLDEFEAVVRSLAVLRESTPRARDFVASVGERLSSRLVAAVLSSRGLAAEAVDGEDVLQTDGAFTNAYPRFEETRARARERLLPLVEAGVVPVVMGFVGASPEGITTTLGRGGTDFSAAVLGEALDAVEVRFLKEVDGIMSADPRVVPGARRLETLTYEEVAELSYFGAKVLHPIAIHPLREKRIPASIRNVLDFEAAGTRVVPRAEGDGAGVKALSTIREVAVVVLEGGGMQGVPGMAGRVFAAIAREGVNVLMISQASSEQNISLVVPGQDRDRALALLRAEFELELLKGRLEGVRSQDEVAVLSVVGDGMRGVPGIAGRIFSVLGERSINVILIAQGSSERNVSFVVGEPDIEEAMRSIHDAFGLGEAR